MKFIEEVRIYKEVVHPNGGAAAVLSTASKVTSTLTFKAHSDKAILIAIEIRSDSFTFRTNEFKEGNPSTTELWVAKSLIGEETDTYIEIETWFCDQKKNKHLFYHLVPAQERYITFQVKTVEEFDRMRSLMAQKIK